jgi:hypothetical protein
MATDFHAGLGDGLPHRGADGVGDPADLRQQPDGQAGEEQAEAGQEEEGGAPAEERAERGADGGADGHAQAVAAEDDGQGLAHLVGRDHARNERRHGGPEQAVRQAADKPRAHGRCEVGGEPDEDVAEREGEDEGDQQGLPRILASSRAAGITVTTMTAA